MFFVHWIVGALVSARMRFSLKKIIFIIHGYATRLNLEFISGFSQNQKAMSSVAGP